MALAQVGWHDDGRSINTFPSELFAATGRLRHRDGTFEIQSFVTNQDTSTWELSGVDGGVFTYRLSTDAPDVRKTAQSIQVAAGELIILYADTNDSGWGIISVNAELNACDVARNAARQRLIVLDVFANRILNDLDSGPVSEDTRISLRSSAVFLRGLARGLRNDFDL